MCMRATSGWVQLNPTWTTHRLLPLTHTLDTAGSRWAPSAWCVVQTSQIPAPKIQLPRVSRLFFRRTHLDFAVGLHLSVHLSISMYPCTYMYMVYIYIHIISYHIISYEIYIVYYIVFVYKYMVVRCCKCVHNINAEWDKFQSFHDDWLSMSCSCKEQLINLGKLTENNKDTYIANMHHSVFSNS